MDTTFCTGSLIVEFGFGCDSAQGFCVERNRIDRHFGSRHLFHYAANRLQHQFRFIQMDPVAAALSDHLAHLSRDAAELLTAQRYGCAWC